MTFNADGNLNHKSICHTDEILALYTFKAICHSDGIKLLQLLQKTYCDWENNNICVKIKTKDSWRACLVQDTTPVVASAYR